VTRRSRLDRALILLVQTYSDVGQSCDQCTWITTKSCPVFHISLVTCSHTNCQMWEHMVKVGTSKARFSDAFVLNSGGMLYDVVIVLEHRKGLRWLRDHDDGLFEVAVCLTCCRSWLCRVLSDHLLAVDISSASHTNRQLMDSRCLGDVELWSVDQCYAAFLPLVASHTDTQFLQAHCVVAGPESVSVQPAHSLRRVFTVMHDRRAGEATSIIDC